VIEVENRIPSEPPLPTDSNLIDLTPKFETSLKEEAAEEENTLKEISLSKTVFDTSVCPIFTQHMSLGDNDGTTGREKQESGVSSILSEVRRLQQVLFNLGFYYGSINGAFDSITEKAVSDWQVVYRTEVLDPWGLRGPTGRFYQSSERWMNILLGCPDSVILDNGVHLK